MLCGKIIRKYYKINFILYIFENNHVEVIELEELLNLRKKMYDLQSNVTKTQIFYNNSRFEINLAPQLEIATFDEISHSNWQYSIAEMCEA